MKYQRWTVRAGKAGAAEALRGAGCPVLLSAALSARGVGTPEEAERFLAREKSLTISPLRMRDMEKAVERISRALAGGEKLAVYGDYDVDGITSTVLLVDYLRSRGADVTMYIPRRVEDGYGLGAEALRTLREKGVTLAVTVDCGITGVEEAAYAREIGLDLVITDHHECKGTLPEACAVVDPRRGDCPYPFKHLAGVGVALKLVLALGGAEREEALFRRYCVLAAIGTVADVMEMSGENRTIVSRGLESIGDTAFIGLTALLREAGLDEREVTSTRIGFVLAPRINAAGRMGRAELAAELLLTRDAARAEVMARELCGLNRERQAVEQEIYAQAEKQIGSLPPEERSALVLSSGTWHQGVVGIVASRLSEKYSCPSFMIRLQNGIGRGSCRSWGGFNLFAALEQCADLLVDFGGHELAAGFSIREELIPVFRERMNSRVREFRKGEAPVSSLELDAVVDDPGDLTLEELSALDALEPFGAGNEKPVFAIMGAQVAALQTVGQNRHLKMRLAKGDRTLDAIFFSATAAEFGVSRFAWVDVAFHLQINEFRGTSSVQLQVLDMRPAEGPCGREAEDLELVRRFLRGGGVTAEERRRLLPERVQLERLWRAVCRDGCGNGTPRHRLPALRRFAGAVGGEEPLIRAALGLAVFRERELVAIEDGADTIAVRPVPGRRADLEESAYIRRLREDAGRETPLPREGEPSGTYAAEGKEVDHGHGGRTIRASGKDDPGI